MSETLEGAFLAVALELPTSRPTPTAKERRSFRATTPRPESENCTNPSLVEKGSNPALLMYMVRTPALTSQVGGRNAGGALASIV